MQEPKKSLPSEKLLRGMTPEERDKFVGSYTRSKSALKIINEYFKKEIASKSVGMDNPSNFDTPNWQYLTAWNAGYRHAMRVGESVTRIK